MNAYAMHGDNLTAHTADAAILEWKTGGTPCTPVTGR
jgi:hypothetical protein